MILSRRVPDALAMLIAVALGLIAGSPALAQDAPQLPTAIITAESLTNQQQGTIDAFVTHRTAQLVDGEPLEVSQARRDLYEPFQVDGATAAFLGYHRDTIASRLDAAFASDRVLVRLNAMILITRMPGRVPEALIDAGLDDSSPAVRYWAARAVREVATAGGLGAGQQQAMLNRLTGRLEAEDATAVVEQLFVALIALPVDVGAQPLLESINHRVSLHAERPGSSVQPERAAMQELFRQLLSAGSNNPPRAAMRQLSRAAVRYMDLLATALEADAVEEHRQQQYADTIALADHLLRTLHAELGGGGSVPAAVTDAVGDADWATVRTAAQRWRGLLQQAPYNFSEDDLGV
ncbi:MAG: hypothetical protein WD009_04100 [Phycisphaeraceae bacterium]